METRTKKKSEHVVITLNLGGKESITINTTIGKLMKILTKDVYNRFGGNLDSITNLLENVLLDERTAIALLRNGFKDVGGLEETVRGIKERLQKRILEQNKRRDSANS